MPPAAPTGVVLTYVPPSSVRVSWNLGPSSIVSYSVAVTIAPDTPGIDAALQESSVAYPGTSIVFTAPNYGVEGTEVRAAVLASDISDDSLWSTVATLIVPAPPSGAFSGNLKNRRVAEDRRRRRGLNMT